MDRYFRQLKEMVCLEAKGWHSDKRVWVAAGGTAGHLLPAVGVAESLVRAGLPRDSVGFLGSKRPLEAQILAPYGFEIKELEVSGLIRSLSLKNAMAILKFLSATLGLWREARRTRPMAVVSFGGYFSFPPIVAARLAGIPSVVVETNAVAGLANKLAAKVATRVFASSESSGMKNADLIGVPLRPEMGSGGEALDGSPSFRSVHGIGRDELVVCVFGGSLGSRTINITLIELLEKWQSGDSQHPWVIYHVIGSRDFADLLPRVKALTEGGSNFRYIYSEFDPEIYKAIFASNLVVSRAGSGTLAELGYFGKPSILVPLPNAPGDHQAKNARTLAEVGAARVISDNELTWEFLGAEIERLLGDPVLLTAMSEESAKAFKGDGSERVAEEVLALTGKGVS